MNLAALRHIVRQLVRDGKAVEQTDLQVNPQPDLSISEQEAMRGLRMRLAASHNAALMVPQSHAHWVPARPQEAPTPVPTLTTGAQ